MSRQSCRQQLLRSFPQAACPSVPARHSPISSSDRGPQTPLPHRKKTSFASPGTPCRRRAPRPARFPPDRRGDDVLPGMKAHLLLPEASASTSSLHFGVVAAQLFRHAAAETVDPAVAAVEDKGPAHRRAPFRRLWPPWSRGSGPPRCQVIHAPGCRSKRPRMISSAPRVARQSAAFLRAGIPHDPGGHLLRCSAHSVDDGAQDAVHPKREPRRRPCWFLPPACSPRGGRPGWRSACSPCG